MSQKSGSPKLSFERIVKDICRATRKQYSAEEKIRIVLDGLRGEHGIAELCQREGIAESLYYIWSKEFLELARSLSSVASPLSLASTHKNKHLQWRKAHMPSLSSMRRSFHMVVKNIIT